MKAYGEMSIRELTDAAKSGDAKARRIAWARVTEAREFLTSSKFATARMVLGEAGLRSIKCNIVAATRSLTA